REAMALFDRHGEAVDLVLTDVIMPALDGPTLVERLRMERPDLPALFMSGYTDDALGRHGVTERDILVLPKPFTQQDLLQAVRSTLDEAAGGAAPTA
ncbi:MAG: response regulator, partial [Candidatus Methylomirabilis sp.]|nr:response regulator [Deltaproteobacteria bacterium]